MSRFFVEVFLTHSIKNFKGERFYVLQNFCYRKMLGIRKGVYRFSVEVVLAHSTKSFRRGTVQCPSNFGYRNFFCLGGLCLVFLSSFLFLSIEKRHKGTLFVFHKSSGAENFFG